MARLWKIGSKMLPIEAEAIAMLAEHIITEPDEYTRSENAAGFIEDLKRHAAEAANGET